MVERAAKIRVENSSRNLLSTKSLISYPSLKNTCCDLSIFSLNYWDFEFGSCGLAFATALGKKFSLIRVSISSFKHLTLLRISYKCLNSLNCLIWLESLKTSLLINFDSFSITSTRFLKDSMCFFFLGIGPWLRIFLCFFQ